MALAMMLLTPAHAASFDCTKAVRPLEKIICSDSELSSLDEKLNESYQNALLKNRELKYSQREWLKALSQCNDGPTPLECLKKSFRERIKTLNSVASNNSSSLGIEILGLSSVNGEKGLQVGDVSSSGPGFKAGIVSGDFITEINSKKINELNEFINLLSTSSGQIISLKIVKKDNSDRVISVKLEPIIEVNPETASPTSKKLTNATKETDKFELNLILVIGVLTVAFILGIFLYMRKNTSLGKAKANHNQDNSSVTESLEIPKDDSKSKPSQEQLLRQQQLIALKKLK